MNAIVVRSRSALSPTTVTALQVLVGARWLCWLWMVGIVVFDRNQLRHPVVAWGAVGWALALTSYSTIEVRRRPGRLVSVGFIVAEVSLAIGLSIVDGYVFQPGHVFATTQSLATQWPLLTMGSVGFAFGPVIAAASGVLIGPAEWLGAVANGFSAYGLREAVSLVATSIFFAACGGVFGWLAQALQRAEAEVADTRAREEVARVMHDTVLQTLALVERRSLVVDPDLATTARTADRELRNYLFGSASRSGDDLESRVRAQVEAAVARTESATPVTVNVVDDGCGEPIEHQELVARAIGEATTNALQHADARKVVVFVEADGRSGIVASIVDDGIGFDTSAPRHTMGIDESIIARVESVGGKAEIRSRTSRSVGTEVLLWSRSSGDTADGTRR